MQGGPGDKAALSELSWDDVDESPVSLEWMFDAARVKPPAPPRKGLRSIVPWGKLVGFAKAAAGSRRKGRSETKQPVAAEGEDGTAVPRAARPKGRFAQVQEGLTLIGAAVGATAFCLLSPQIAPFLGALAVLSAPEKLPKLLRPRMLAIPPHLARTLKPFRIPALGLGALRLSLPIVAPSVWRGVSYWHAIPPAARPSTL